MQNNLQSLAALEGDGYYTTSYEAIGSDGTTTTVVRTTYIAANATVPVDDNDENLANAYVGTARGAAVSFQGYSPNVVIDLAGDSDTSLVDLINAGGTSYTSVTAVRGSDGNSTILGSSAAETIYAGEGNSYIDGGAGRDVLISDNPNKYGSATFSFGVGDGKDTIYGFAEYDAEHPERSDVLELSAEVDDIRVLNGNLRFSLNSSDQVTLVDMADKRLELNNVVTAIGDELEYDAAVGHYMGMSEDNATITVGDIAQDINVWMNLGGIEGFEDFGQYDDIKVFDASGFYENATIVGGFDKDNEIYAGRGENSLWGGNGGDDVLYGNSAGKSQYFYLYGDGTDVIEDAGTNDVVNLLNIGLEEFNFADGEPLQYDSTHVKMNFADGGSLDVKSTSEDIVFQIKDGSQWKLNRTENTLDYQGGRQSSEE